MFMVNGKKKNGRNNLLVWLAMVVIGSMLALAGCDSDNDDDESPQPQTSKTLSFESVPVPVTDAQKREILASSSVMVTETAPTAALAPGDSCNISYNIIARSGDNIGGTIFGRILDQNGNPVLNSDTSEFISNDNDFSSLIPIGSKLFNISHFESRPGAMYLTELSQDATTGALTAVNTTNIDFSSFGGLWVPCAGSVTPWGNHLGSEEYPPNARAIEEAATPADIDTYFKPMLRYFGIVDPFDAAVTIDAIKNNFKPYRYGYPVEVAVAENGTPTVNKRYAMGRMALELAYVMPDQKTVYMSDDGTNVGLFMFIADTAGDLSAGQLYAAKWHQKNGSDNDKYDLGGPNDIQLPYNTCGTVYGLDVVADETMGSDYVAHNMNGVVSGTMMDYPAGSDYENNTCDVNGIANPDNLTMIPGYNTLIIGEDTGSGHQNDAIWAYNLVNGELTRIQTTPYGSETTSPYFYSNVGGFAYLMSVVQHPYGESDEDQLVDASDARGYIGYIGPFPPMD